MAPQGTESGGNKQKITMIVVIVVVLVVIWQVVGLFGGGSSSTETASTVSATSPGGASPAGAMGAAAPGASGAVGSMPSAPSTPSLGAAGQPQQAAVQINTTLMKMQQETETKYIAAVNELQMLKIQREIAETNQAITKAKLDTVTSEKNISDLLIKPAPPPVPESAYAANLAQQTGQPKAVEEPVAPAAPVEPAKPMPAPVVVSVTNDIAYLVLSVSKQGNRWNAILGNSGRLYNVGVGDNVPADGSLVVAINNKGVVLKKDGKERTITLTSAI